MTYTYRSTTREPADVKAGTLDAENALRQAQLDDTMHDLINARRDLDNTLDRLAAIATRRDEIQAEVDELLEQADILRRLTNTLRTQVTETPYGALYMERFGKRVAA